MFEIKNLLERYKNFTVPSRASVKAVCAAIQEVLQITVQEKNVEVSRGIARVSLSGTEKSELLLRKNEVLALVRIKTGESLKDIR
jgi:hypothetical protein